MDQLPQELICNILEHLSLKDCNNILAAYQTKDAYIIQNTASFNEVKEVPLQYTKCTIDYFRLLDAINDRKSVVKYLSKYFVNTSTLMEILLNGALIYGSRALEFFVGNSCTEESDWNFMIPSNSSNIQSFMGSMISCGVEWISTFKEFEEKLTYIKDEIKIQDKKVHFLYKYIKSNNISGIAADVINVLKNHIDLRQPDELEDRTLGITWLVSPSIPELTVKTFRVFSYDEFIVNSYDTISGKLNYQGKVTKVKLRLAPNNEHILNSIIYCQCSATQCFISGSIACHMYAHDAYNNQSTVWDLSTVTSTADNSDMSKLLRKYNNRGYKIYNSSTLIRTNPTRNSSMVKRSIEDCNTDIIDIREDSFSENLRSRMNTNYRILSNYQWLETKTRLFIADIGNLKTFFKQKKINGSSKQYTTSKIVQSEFFAFS